MGTQNTPRDGEAEARTTGPLIARGIPAIDRREDMGEIVRRLAALLFWEQSIVYIVALGLGVVLGWCFPSWRCPRSPIWRSPARSGDW